MPSSAKKETDPAQYPTAAPWIPARPSLARLRDSARACQGCPLYARATQTVFGEGSARAKVVFVGEQPGDKEDLEGRPFVGPAGQMLDRALEQAGIPRAQVYVTNAVKHFRWKPAGKRRLHDKPRAGEIRACRPWLVAELGVLKPRVVVCLGATAAQALLGPQFRVTRERGKFLATEFAPWLMATVHPSSLLRIPDAEERAAAFAEFVRDLGGIRAKL
ncbi:MAG: UdgX family uracil-DNA binding protein [Acidobacteria bacterium]|nr:UdgX family uracil-DNA binding protein [Acidobacteriota bacterium]